ncbi:MAG: DUF934 domain-containing protein [Hyphomicrobiales bacterium]
MPLIDATGLTADGFTRPADAAELPPGGVILPLARLAAEGELVLARGDRLGVDLPNTAKLRDIEAFLDRLALVSIGFPSFADGRGFSLAKQIRMRGYLGRLRASGPLIADQMRHALGCGFDEVEAPEALLARQPISQWLAGLGAITLRYQRDAARGLSILDQRLAARRRLDERRMAHAA